MAEPSDLTQSKKRSSLIIRLPKRSRCERCYKPFPISNAAGRVTGEESRTHCLSCITHKRCTNCHITKPRVEFLKTCRIARDMPEFEELANTCKKCRESHNRYASRKRKQTLRPGLRTCARCTRVVPEDEFRVDGNGTIGRGCKICRQRARARYVAGQRSAARKAVQTIPPAREDPESMDEEETNVLAGNVVE